MDGGLKKVGGKKDGWTDRKINRWMDRPQWIIDNRKIDKEMYRHNGTTDGSIDWCSDVKDGRKTHMDAWIEDCKDGQMAKQMYKWIQKNWMQFLENVMVNKVCKYKSFPDFIESRHVPSFSECNEFHFGLFLVIGQAQHFTIHVHSEFLIWHHT